MEWIKAHWLWIAGAVVGFGGIMIVRGASAANSQSENTDASSSGFDPSTYFLPSTPVVATDGQRYDTYQNWQSDTSAATGPVVNTPTTGATPVPGTDFGSQFLDKLGGIITSANTANASQLNQVLTAQNAQNEMFSDLYAQATTSQTFLGVIDKLGKNAKDTALTVTPNGVVFGSLKNTVVQDVVAPGSSASRLNQANATNTIATNNAKTETKLVNQGTSTIRAQQNQAKVINAPHVFRQSLPPVLA